MATETAKVALDRMELLVSSSPHFHGGESIRKIMWNVVLAMLPAVILAIVFFGLDAVLVIGLTTASCMLFEALAQKIRKVPVRVLDGSAVVTGVLLALNLPSSSPWWLCIVGAFIAIVIAKELYGGLGYNPFNPALVARVALLISFPAQMTKWNTTLWMPAEAPDGVTSATPLGMLQEGLAVNFDWNMVIGNIKGSLGETSVVALLIGGLYLLWKGYINWRVPVGFIGSVFVFTGAAFVIERLTATDATTAFVYANPIFHVVAGGLIIGAFFMATDMVTSPVTTRAIWIFAIGCGLLTSIIRLWGGYPEGVSFAILIMNATVPLLDRYLRPKVFGQRKIHAEVKA